MRPADDPNTVTLSLISHTNVGKTTLARTLLRRDIGEVADAAHVTDISEAHVMIETGDGLRMMLWDTPGFGDSAQLLKRLRASGSPIGWLLSQVWDRFRDRPLWCSQQAVRNVQADADVVLYLVNATEDPATAAYVGMEMQILEWIGKPVVVLLNQLGPPREAARDAADLARWSEAMKPFTVVRESLGLDAFARCWVQEEVLLDAVGRHLPAHKQPAHAALTAAWRARSLEVFEASMQVLAGQVAAAACDQEPVPGEDWSGKLRGLVAGALGRESSPGRKRAMGALAMRLDAAIVESTNELIRLHSLEGAATSVILERLRENFAVEKPVDAGVAALLGGFATGALAGLKADLAAGGLTFGGGALVGGLLGAASAAGLAKGYNLVRGAEHPAVRWAPELLSDLVRGALLRYLAVAHFGRGRGPWQQSEAPRFWQDEIEAVVGEHRARLDAGLRRAREGGSDGAGMLQAVLADLAQAVLARLHPVPGRAGEPGMPG
jgi:hypothetical protein